MAIDAKALYQETILDHGEHPRNMGALAGATHEATAHNPLCGDRITMRLVVEGDRVREVKFEARGCLIAKASASLLTELARDRTREEIATLALDLDALLDDHETERDAGVLGPLAGARAFPARVACVTLPWKCVQDALKKAVSYTHLFVAGHSSSNFLHSGSSRVSRSR